MLPENSRPSGMTDHLGREPFPRGPLTLWNTLEPRSPLGRAPVGILNKILKHPNVLELQNQLGLKGAELGRGKGTRPLVVLPSSLYSEPPEPLVGSPG